MVEGERALISMHFLLQFCKIVEFCRELSQNVKIRHFLSTKKTYLSEEIILNEVRLRGSPTICVSLVMTLKKVTERKLGEHSPGLLLNSSLTILANSVVDNIRTVVVHRLLMMTSDILFSGPLQVVHSGVDYQYVLSIYLMFFCMLQLVV